jgi:hypothetical protein
MAANVRILRGCTLDGVRSAADVLGSRAACRQGAEGTGLVSPNAGIDIAVPPRAGFGDSDFNRSTDTNGVDLKYGVYV